MWVLPVWDGSEVITRAQKTTLDWLRSLPADRQVYEAGLNPEQFLELVEAAGDQHGLTDAAIETARAKAQANSRVRRAGWGGLLSL